MAIFERKVRKYAGMRIDKYLHVAGLGMSRSQIQKLIEKGCVKVNTKPVKSNYTLSAGDVIVVEYEKEEPLRVEPEPIPIDVVYEDEHVIVVNKPAGMVTHPAPGHLRGTLINALLYHCKLAESDDKVRPGTVHRLDMDTSGLIMFAKTREALTDLSKQIQARRVTRIYRAFVLGNVPLDQGEIEAPIGRDTIERKRMAVTPLLSKNAITYYKVLERFKLGDAYISYLELKLGTGRTHQIRVHLAHLGFPVVGDATYGGRSRPVGFPPDIFNQIMEILKRHALHAYLLGFTHPVTRKWIELETPLPEDMQKLYELLKKLSI